MMQPLEAVLRSGASARLQRQDLAPALQPAVDLLTAEPIELVEEDLRTAGCLGNQATQSTRCHLTMLNARRLQMDEPCALWGAEGFVRESLRSVGWIEAASLLSTEDARAIEDRMRLLKDRPMGIQGIDLRVEDLPTLSALHEAVARVFVRATGLDESQMSTRLDEWAIGARIVRFHNDSNHLVHSRGRVNAAFVVTSLQSRSHAALVFPQLGFEVPFGFGDTVVFDFLEPHGMRRRTPARRGLACVCASSTVRVAAVDFQRLGCGWNSRHQAMSVRPHAVWMPIVDPENGGLEPMSSASIAPVRPCAAPLKRLRNILSSP